MPTNTTVTKFQAKDYGNNPVDVPVLPETYKVDANGTITAPASASQYTIGSMICPSSPAPFIWTAARIASGLFRMDELWLELTGTDTLFNNQPVNMEIYETTPTITGGDRTLWTLNTSNSGHVGQMTGVLNKSFGAGTQTAIRGLLRPTLGDSLLIRCDASKQFYGVLVAGATFTPANATHVFNSTVGGLAY
jgi:hypothetical protein